MTFTERVFCLYDHGLTPNEIAKRLGISDEMVMTYLSLSKGQRIDCADWADTLNARRIRAIIAKKET